jgi:UDPglucose--hexose-1-phosphate uridylyltransferase
MSDLRHDPINDQWITVAGNRRDRPMEFIPLEQTRQQLICPFCKGNEDETPVAISAYRGDGTLTGADDDPSDWLVRVINNKYPAFSLNGSTTNVDTQANGPFQSMSASGSQELIIPSPRHVTSISELTSHELLLSFWVNQQRIKHVQSKPQIKHAMLFLNCRSAAGASLSHIHHQLIGSPVLGGHLRGRVDRNAAHARQNGCSILRSMMDWEIKQGKRILELTDNFCVVCPYASRFPFQVWIVPRKHESDFCECPDEIRDEAATLCQSWISRLESVMENPSYNMLLHIEPFAVKQNRHWYFEIFPRLTNAAGFEWGTDIWVNPISPESSVRRLRVV